MQEPAAGLAPHDMRVHLRLHSREICIYFALEVRQMLAERPQLRLVMRDLAAVAAEQFELASDAEHRDEHGPDDEC